MKNKAVVALAFVITVPVSSPVIAPAQDSSLVWPRPPEPARIGYVGSLQTERDLGRGRSFFNRIFGAFTGGGGNSDALERPGDIYSVAGEKVFVSDGATGQVFVFDREEKRITKIGGEGVGELGRAIGLSGDGEHLYVADAAQRRIAVYTLDGTFVRAFGGSDVLLNPVDVSVDRERDRFYVADSYLHQIIVFNSAGEITSRIGRDVADLSNLATAQRRWAHGDPDSLSHGKGPSDAVDNRGGEPGEFRYPTSIAVAPDGTLYVSDVLNFRVQVFDSDGQFVRVLGGLGDTPGSFARPKGVAVDSDGNVFVVDAAFNNVQAFNENGEFLIAFASGGQGPGELLLPLGMYIDSANNLYIADRFNNRTQVFQLLEVEEDHEAVGSLQE